MRDFHSVRMRRLAGAVAEIKAQLMEIREKLDEALDQETLAEDEVDPKEPNDIEGLEDHIQAIEDMVGRMRRGL